MTLYDPTQKLYCDDCDDMIEIELHYGFNDYSGDNGQYREVSKHDIEREGWHIIDDEHHVCESCYEERNEDDKTTK